MEALCIRRTFHRYGGRSFLPQGQAPTTLNDGKIKKKTIPLLYQWRNRNLSFFRRQAVESLCSDCQLSSQSYAICECTIDMAKLSLSELLRQLVELSSVDSSFDKDILNLSIDLTSIPISDRQHLRFQVQSQSSKFEFNRIPEFESNPFDSVPSYTEETNVIRNPRHRGRTKGS